MAITVEDIRAARETTLAQGSFFELEDVELDGQTYKTYKHAPKTAIDIIQSGRNHGDLDFIVYQDQRYTYTSYFEAVDALAASLQAQYGIAKGDRVAIAMRNNPEWVISFAAATLIGAIPVPINSWGKTEELAYATADCGAKVLVCDLPRFKLIEERLGDLNIDVMVASSDAPAADRVANLSTIIDANKGKTYDIAETLPEDGCLILYTSGSTGFPKGVLHRNIGLGNALFNMMWLGMLVAELEGGLRQHQGGAERETPLLTVPLFHGTGLLGSYYMPMYLAQKVVMMYKWDAAQALQLIEDEKVTSMSTVPAILQDLLSQTDFDNYQTGSLMRVAAAGAAIPAGLPELIEKRINNPSRSAGYAMTESLAVGSTQSGILFDFKPNASGVVSPIMQFRTVDPDGNILPEGEAGELQMLSVACTPGYWEKPEANEQTFIDGRWMKTGDVGLIDADGFVHITGRIKEIVIRGGENIYPGEIEQAAFELDRVHEVVVFGEPDPTMGEEMVMMAYVKPGISLTEPELRDFLKQRLAGYKVPKTILFSDNPLPRNASEKLHKLKVKEAYLEAKAGS